MENNHIIILMSQLVFRKVNANNSEYRHASQTLHVSSPLALLSEHHRTQAHCPQMNLPLASLSLSTGKDSVIKERLGIHFTLLLQSSARHPIHNPVLSSPSWIKLTFD